jgi:hypothetical protein
MRVEKNVAFFPLFITAQYSAQQDALNHFFSLNCIKVYEIMEGERT